MALSITSLYAGLLTLVFIALCVLVIRERFRVRTSVGDGGHKDLTRRMRVQANFAEYVPLALLLMLCTELQGAPAVAIHAMGATLLVGRLCHAVGMSLSPQVFPLRQAGMVLTFLMMAVSAVTIIGHVIV
ncbi:MAG: MAPEG family protein [Sulfitobacter sp.]